VSIFLPFERSLAELESQIADLRAKAQATEGLEIEDEVRLLEERIRERLRQIYRNLTPWQRCLIARHPDRPHAAAFAEELLEEFLPLAGDRAFGEDFAVIGGPARFRGRSVMFLGQEKGGDTESRLMRNFGMARPEGYRKAIRLMALAERFRLPLVTVIDTPGAYPGRGAEERGQAEAIARAVDMSLGLGVPSVAVILGEGGSGGAVALASASRVIMLEHAVYSVISPEGCASILWRDAERAEAAAAALRLTAGDLLKLNVVDRIVDEPEGGAHREPREALAAVGNVLEQELDSLIGRKPEELRRLRSDKFLAMGTAAAPRF